MIWKIVKISVFFFDCIPFLKDIWLKFLTKVNTFRRKKHVELSTDSVTDTYGSK